MAETKERFLLKFLRDAVLTILGGLVIEPTLQRIHFDVGPYLRQIWFGIFGFITLDALWRSKMIREWAHEKYHSFGPRNRKMSYLIVAAIGAICFCLYWFAVVRLISEPQAAKDVPVAAPNERPKPSAEASLFSPAGFITFIGQVIDGHAPMMQENQTDTPLDDVHLSIIESVPKSAEPNTENEWGSGTVVWQEEIDIGTCRARLTTGLLERFPIAGQKRLFFHIFMMTRFQSYRETMKLTRTSEQEYSAELDFYAGDAKPLYTRNMKLGITTLKAPHIAGTPPDRPPAGGPKPDAAMNEVWSISDAQRLGIKDGLKQLAGNGLRLVVIGNTANAKIARDQIRSVFEGWTIEEDDIGQVVGPNLYGGCYMTAADISSQLVGKVYSLFHGHGVNLPVIPNAFAGPMSQGAAKGIVLVVQ